MLSNFYRAIKFSPILVSSADIINPILLVDIEYLIIPTFDQTILLAQSRTQTAEMQCTANAVTSTDLGSRAGAPAPPGPNDRRSPSPFSDLGGVKVKWAASHLVLGLAHDQHPPPVWRLLNVKQEKAAKANDASMSQSMSQSSNAVVYALICGLILFIVLPHALAALDRRRFLRRLRRAFESGTLQPLWPADAVVCPREIKDMCHVWTNSVVFGNDEIDLVRAASCLCSRIGVSDICFFGSPC